MPEVTIELKFITPCFCAGADQKNAEIRVPSIRGQLRWWYRACGASREDEAKLFGSTDTGRSPVRIRVLKTTAFRKAEAFGGTEDPKAWRSLSEDNDLAKYLWYFMGAQERYYLPAGSGCHLQLHAANTELLERASAVARLWGRLGALGSRTTRAAGGLSVVVKDNKPGEFADKGEILVFAATSIAELGLPKKSLPFDFYVRRCTGKAKPGGKNTDDMLFGKAEDAALHLAKTWRDFRFYKGSGIGDKDYNKATRKSPGTGLMRPAMGLPYAPWGTPVHVQEDGWLGKATDPRHPSPVHLRVFPMSGGKYLAGAIRFLKSWESGIPNHIMEADSRREFDIDKRNALIEFEKIFTKIEVPPCPGS